LPQGTKLFGRVVEQRRVHSMRSACQTAQIWREVVEQMLIDRGIGERREDGLFRLISPLTVELVDELMAEKGSFLNNMETADYLPRFRDNFNPIYKYGLGADLRQRRVTCAIEVALMVDFLRCGRVGLRLQRKSSSRPHARQYMRNAHGFPKRKRLRSASIPKEVFK